MDISSLLEVQVREIPPLATSISDTTTKAPVSLKPSQIISHDETVFFNKLFGNDIAQVRFRRLHCTACDAHIGSAPFDAENMHEHPILKTLLCSSCRIFYGDGEFEQGDDATDMFCRWCANGGNLYCCSYCSNTFCDKCIKRNFDSVIRKKIEADEKWKCFVCDPKDLYVHRAVCRALLEHVRTLARIFMTDRSMSQQEIETRMELDDSQCCLGRNFKRKRHNSDSNDEDNDFDDDDYNDEDYDENYESRSRKRNKNGSRKRRKSSSSSIAKEKPQATVNGTSRFIPIAPKYIIQDVISTGKDKSDEQDLRAPLLCEQTMIECENQTVTPQGIVVPVTKYVRSKIPDSILNNTAISLNPIPKQNIIHTTQSHSRPIAIRPLHKVNSIPSGAKIHRLPTNTINANSIVAIPAGTPIITMDTSKSTTSNSTTSQSGNYLRCKDLTKSLNVINIDSDSEETTIVRPSNPLQIENDANENSELVEKSAKSLTSSRTINFQEAIDHPLKKIDDLLQVFRKQLELDFETMERTPGDDVVDNRQKIKIINENIEKIVNELTAFNNVMVSKFKPWKKAHENGETFDDSTEMIVLNKHERSSKFTTLDMECVRDSEPDEEYEDDNDMDINSLLVFSQKINKIIDIKDFISQGTLARIETEDKAIQCYDIPKEVDFDKSIGYSLLMKADYNDKENTEIYKPVIIHDKNFGKYEEQFIFYLQHLEDRKNLCDDENPEEMKELVDLIDTDLEKNNLMKKLNSDKLISTTKVTKIISSDNLNDNNENSSINKNINICNENEKILSEKQLKDSTEIIRRRRRKDSHEVKDNDEIVIAVNSLIDEEDCVNRCNNWENLSNDDECTILD
ncbi:uncharacterized protein ADD1 [Chelonus insularis]|uniref:uncharacterized protein ADD1 n=1 Tax=Chelonus insularis TaxID=460826 RepID=UPI00158F2F32|nr:uncharacterized protein LOC118075092 [Chelonus insularis]